MNDPGSRSFILMLSVMLLTSCSYHGHVEAEGRFNASGQLSLSPACTNDPDALARQAVRREQTVELAAIAICGKILNQLFMDEAEKRANAYMRERVQGR